MGEIKPGTTKKRYGMGHLNVIIVKMLDSKVCRVAADSCHIKVKLNRYVLDRQDKEQRISFLKYRASNGFK